MVDAPRGKTDYSPLHKQATEVVPVRPKQRTTLAELRQRKKPAGRKGQSELGVDRLIASWEDVTQRALEFIDDPALAAATAKELADVATKGTQNIQLLKGLPTQILGATDRASLGEVMKMALQEARRRNMIDISPEGYTDITPEN